MTMERPDWAGTGAIAAHVRADVPIAAPIDRVGAVRRGLENRRFTEIGDVAVCREGRIVGLLRLEDLFAAPAAETVEAVMDRDPPVVAPGMDQEAAAWKAVRHGESSLAVADADGRFHGLVPPHALLQVLLREHDEDLARLSGYLQNTQSARGASEEPVLRRLLHRLPWLLVGLIGALLSVEIVGAFEADLEASVILAFFVPAIVYLADAVGTQTETLVVRGLAVGVPIRRVIRREVVTGFGIGLTLAAIAGPLVLLRWDSAELALAVALALLAASSVATLVAASFPWALQRLGIDPAFGSGPLATVIQDLLSILIYFAIAVPLAA